MRTAFLRLGMVPALFAAALFAGSMVVSLPQVKAAGAADSYAREMTRLINGARQASGKPALAIDNFLASKARDGDIPCPDDPSQTIPGRAKDFADYNQMSHQLRLCDASGYVLSDQKFVNTLQSAWGYGSVGEILLVNGGYGGGQFLYTYKSWTTWTYSTTGHAMLGWATSSTHWNIIMGSYDRFGCGGWSPSGTTVYYACLFAGGGPTPAGVSAAPKASPFNDPVPTPAPTPTPGPTKAPVRTTPKPAAKTSMPSASATTSATDSPAAGASATDTLIPTVPPATPSASATAVVLSATEPASSPSTGPALAANTQPARPSGPPESEIAYAAGGAAAWLGLFGLLLLSRRRRLRDSTTLA